MTQRGSADYDGPTGTVRLELGEIEVPVEAIVSRWTRDEAAALVAGSDEARDELISQACSRRELWSGYDLNWAEVKLDGGPR